MCDVNEQVQKLIEVLALTLRCSHFSKDPKSFALNVQRALYVALQNLTTSSEADWNDGTGGENQTSTGSQRSFIFPSFTPFLRRSMGNGSSDGMLDHRFNMSNTMMSGGGGGEAPPSFQLHRLEIIKVVVLIVVISIILLTTCRMVFQLFLRFRPEKSP